MHKIVIYDDSSDSTKLSYLVQEVDRITSELEAANSTIDNKQKFQCLCGTCSRRFAGCNLKYNSSCDCYDEIKYSA